MTRIVHALLLCVLILRASSAVAQDAATTTAPAAEVTNPALAERLAAAAQETARNRDAGQPAWRASAALLRAANRLAPTEPRFARLLAEAVARLGEDQATIDALTAYRQLAPDDQSAQTEQIDLFLRVMETADAKVSYLRGVSGSDQVVAPVRAHAAFRLAEVLAERSQMTESDAALAQALKLDPLNLDALSMQYARLPADAPTEKRVAALLALIRANPAQPQIAAVLARELSTVGLNKSAFQWYATAFGIYQNTGTPPSPQEAVDYAAQAYIAGEPKVAENLLGQLVGVIPENVEAWLLRQIVARSSGDKEAADRARKQAAIALTNVLADIRKAAGEEGATTQPVDPPADAQWPDPAAVLERVKAANKPELVQAFAEAALSTAWFKTYFEEKPDEAQPWINVLRGLLVDESQTIARLEGWAFLIGNKPDEAKVKLSAAAETDPLAALGMIRLAGNEGDAKAAADAQGQELLAKNGYGLTGATIAEALSFRGIKPQSPPAVEPVTTELAKFPGAFMRILDAPGAFYSLRVEPVKISHAFGDPILLKLTVQNIGEHDLTVGPDGIIRSDLWIDGQLRGIANQPFPGVAFDRLAGPVVLPAKKAITQVVRVSQGALADYLATNPTASIQLNFTAMTNPTGLGGQVQPGPAGQRVPSSRLVERRGTPNNAAAIEQRATDALNNAPAPEKVRQLELVTTFAQLLQRQARADDNTANALAALLDVIRRGSADADPNVRAWALYCGALLGTDEDRAAAVDALSGNPAWQTRLLAVLLSQTTGQARPAVARLAESDADALVKQYAAAVAAMPATTQPTTNSATQPATAP
jgi:hypothetical protein